MSLESSESYREHIGDKYYEDTNVESINSSSTTLHITTTEKKMSHEYKNSEDSFQLFWWQLNSECKNWGKTFIC